MGGRALVATEGAARWEDGSPAQAAAAQLRAARHRSSPRRVVALGARLAVRVQRLARGRGTTSAPQAFRQASFSAAAGTKAKT